MTIKNYIEDVKGLNKVSRYVESYCGKEMLDKLSQESLYRIGHVRDVLVDELVGMDNNSERIDMLLHTIISLCIISESEGVELDLLGSKDLEEA